MESEEGKIEAPEEISPEIQNLSDPTEKAEAIVPIPPGIQIPNSSESLENQEIPEAKYPVRHENDEEILLKIDEDSNLRPEVHEASPNTQIRKKIDLDAINSVNGSNCESPSSPRVFVSLKSPTRVSAKKPGLNLEIANSLVGRRCMVDNKINNLRLKHKADEIGNMRNVPEIDCKSRQIAEGKLKKAISLKNTNSRKKDTQDQEISSSSSDFIPDSPRSMKNISNSNPVTQKKITSINLDLLKTAMKLRESEKDRKQPNTPRANLANKTSKQDLVSCKKGKIDLNQRAKISKEKKDKILQETMTEREKQALEHCTFKPNLLARNQMSDSGSFLIKRSQSGKISTVDASMNIRTAQSPSSKMLLNCSRVMFEENFALTNVELVNNPCLQISPVNFNVKYHHGYNEKSLRSKARPMVDYKSIGSQLD